MAEIRHLENRHEVIFTPVGGPILIKFRRLVQNDMSTPVMWSKSKPDVEFQYSGRLCEFHGMSSQPPASLQGTATWRIQCYDPRATCHIVGCCHRANSMACHPRATCHFAGYYYCHYHDPSRRAGAGGKGHLPPTFSASGASNMVCPLLISTNFD